MRELEPRCSQCGEPGATLDEAHGDYRCFAYRACWERRGLQSGVEAIPLAHQADMAQAANAWVLEHAQTPYQQDIPSLETLLIEVYKQGREHAQRATNMDEPLAEESWFRCMTCGSLREPGYVAMGGICMTQPGCLTHTFEPVTVRIFRRSETRGGVK